MAGYDFHVHVYYNIQFFTVLIFVVFKYLQILYLQERWYCLYVCKDLKVSWLSNNNKCIYSPFLLNPLGLL